MEKIKKGKIYIFNNGFDPEKIVIALEGDKKKSSLNDVIHDIVYNLSLDLVEVLKENIIETVMISDLYKITGVKYDD